jgi:DNA-directed RNA polymerase subunit RPC12/RpoP
MIINFKCTKCKKIFNSDVGNVSINEKTFRPDFENDINCPKCGIRTIDQVTLTELGQSQLTEATFDL